MQDRTFDRTELSLPLRLLDDSSSYAESPNVLGFCIDAQARPRPTPGLSVIAQLRKALHERRPM
jgi:hypothetical protein